MGTNTREYGSVTSPRACTDCGVDISERHLRSIRCGPCQKAKNLAVARDSWYKHHRPTHARGDRLCEDCGVNIGELRGNARFCRSCVRARPREIYRQKHPRACPDCGKDITTRGNRAVRCASCAEAHMQEAARSPEQRARNNAAARATVRARRATRVCVDCGASIANRRTKAQRCVPCATRRNRHMVKSPEYRARANARQNHRYQNDPDLRKRAIQRATEYMKNPAHKARRNARQRTTEYRQKRNARWFSRYAQKKTMLYEHQRGVCPICQKALTEPLEIDHKHPSSKGGSSHIFNLQLTHAACNASKKDKIADPNVRFEQLATTVL